MFLASIMTIQGQEYPGGSPIINYSLMASIQL